MTHLIVLCDGTSNEDFDESPSTNIQRIGQLLKPQDLNGERQISFYQDGVGTQAGEGFKGGAFGFGLDRNIKEAYKFLCDNYQPGDKISLFGFSRGAFTVRSLASFMYHVGMLKKDRELDLLQLDPAVIKKIRKNAQKNGREFKLTALQGGPEKLAYGDEAIAYLYEIYRSRNEVIGDEKLLEIFQRRNREALGHADAAKACQEVNIEFLGVFDTVKAMDFSKDAYHDEDLHVNVRRAAHAMAIDEERIDFRVSMWQPNGVTEAEQCWFPGDHCDVGGGHDNSKKHKGKSEQLPPEAHNAVADIPLTEEAKERGLSHFSLDWMLKKSGLNYQTQVFELGQRYELKPELLKDSTIHNYATSNVWPLNRIYAHRGESYRHVCAFQQSGGGHYLLDQKTEDADFVSPRDDLGNLRWIRAHTGKPRHCPYTDTSLFSFGESTSFTYRVNGSKYKPAGLIEPRLLQHLTNHESLRLTQELGYHERCTRQLTTFGSVREELIVMVEDRSQLPRDDLKAYLKKKFHEAKGDLVLTEAEFLNFKDPITLLERAYSKNRDMMNALLQIPGIQVDMSLLKKVCKDGNLEVLRQLLVIKGIEIDKIELHRAGSAHWADLERVLDRYLQEQNASWLSRIAGVFRHGHSAQDVSGSQENLFDGVVNV